MLKDKSCKVCRRTVLRLDFVSLRGGKKKRKKKRKKERKKDSKNKINKTGMAYGSRGYRVGLAGPARELQNKVCRKGQIAGRLSTNESRFVVVVAAAVVVDSGQ